MKLVVDSSVALKWFVDEPRSDAAQRIILADDQLIAPDWAFAEVINALWRKARIVEIGVEQVQEAITELPNYIEFQSSDIGLMGLALEIAIQLKHSIYDCVFLAIALQSESAVLVTDDRKFAEKAASGGYADKLRTLDEQPLRLTFTDSHIDRIRQLHSKSKEIIESVYAKVKKPLGIGTIHYANSSDLEPAFLSPSYTSLSRVIAKLSTHEASVLLALCWLGRGHDGYDFNRLYDQAGHLASDPEDHAPYIISQIGNLDKGIATYEKLSSDVVTKG